MTSTQPLEIKVIYSSSSRRVRRGKTVGTLRVYAGSRAVRTKSWVCLGAVNLIVAGVLCYGTWWRVDPYLYVTMVMRTPVVDVDLDTVATQMFGIPPKRPASPTPTLVDKTESPPPAPDQPEQTPRYRSETARAVIVGSAYAWLALATIACCAVALSGGASLGRGGGRSVRVFGAIVACGALPALGYVGYQVWGEYGRQFQPTHLRTGMSLLVLLTAFVGLVVARDTRRLARLAGVLLILSAAGSVAGLYFGARAGAVAPEQSTLTFLAIVFIVHSLYGWILLPVSSRIAR